MTEEQNKLAEEQIEAVMRRAINACVQDCQEVCHCEQVRDLALAALRREPATEAVLRHIEAVTKAEEVVFNAAIVADDRMRYEEAKNLRKLSDALKKVSADLSAAIREPATEAMLEMAAKECEEAYDNLKQYSAVGPDQLLLAAKRIRALKGKGASQGELHDKPLLRAHVGLAPEPSGEFVRVPREPTQEMVTLMNYPGPRPPIREKDVRLIWETMLAACPNEQKGKCIGLVDKHMKP